MADGKRRDGGDEVGGAEAERTRPDQRLPKRDGTAGESAAVEDETREDPGDERVAGETIVDEPSPRVPEGGWTAELPAPSGDDAAEAPEPDAEREPGPEPEATRPAPLPAGPSEDEPEPEPASEPAPVSPAEATRPAPLPSAPRPADPADADVTTPAPLPAAEPATPAPAPAPSVPAPRAASAPPPAPAPPVQGGTSGGTAKRGESPTWHRQHYTVGMFLLAYGVMSLVSGTLLWGDRRDEVGDYFASGPSGTILGLAKAVQVVLVLATVAAMARRRDTWFVPPLAGWMAGFALFAVLDVYTGRWGGLLEHLLYLAGFVILLFLSYGLSAKAQVGGAARAPGEEARPVEGLTRTQELALAAINRLPRR
ncbi:hypothetical protein [Actinomadura algeriensis]|uniref:Uncharacterized protein n=1 Tax=Actinomadura algeriensis TaxID=1679523 RepID=A0ABR9JWA4_9ACTN|nr:hypothetical protein [Actinomadura algeriensis]MBE1534861.1 hypothetical protein [Actinomadura algeriensis]